MQMKVSGLMQSYNPVGEDRERQIGRQKRMLSAVDQTKQEMGTGELLKVGLCFS
jgi:hypothetical protein